ncbi:laccase 2 precursor [Russula earlei]|uniref:Laccase 2 n=1 Tax=Russula earlei TaxID=71964 RepID=A0ACC0UHL1_9AGAM|nr:laccase 2 precursor [Russula earlei]
MMQLCTLAVILAVLSGEVSAAQRPTDPLVISNAIVAPDGFARSAVVAGGVFPGPLIAAVKPAKFSIEVLDLLADGSMDLETSIHWHGIFQKTTNYADGGAFVNQCPIVPLESFRYKFSAGEQTGTYWYHSHFQAQYCDGLRGPLVIYDPNDPHASLYDVDNENTVITLGDWYHNVSAKVSQSLIPTFDSTLINGKGRYLGGPPVPLAVVNVERNRRYRLRIVSISCDPAYKFSIDSHQLTVIEVDGINVQPLLVDSLEIFAGQRYSVVLTANQPIGNYWIRALPTHFENQTFAGFTNVAILRYLGARIQNPPSDPNTNIPPSALPLKETDLHPFVPTPVPGNPFPGGADININLNVILDTKNLANPKSVVFRVNNSTFTSPKVPVLLQILSGVVNASQLLPKGSIYGLERNKSVELSIPAGAPGGPHPIHLHGHAFHVVRSAGNSTYNYDNPVIRDVVSIGDSGDNVTIRFFTDNPGPWFLHCHIDWHLERGFAVVFAEDAPDVKTEDVVTVDWANLCPVYDQFLSLRGSPP